MTIGSIVVFVENRLQSGFTYAQLERATGFSLAHLRALFARHMGQSLTRYVLSRRIAHAAFDLIHTDQSILFTAQKYGFACPDTFTRAFRRVTGFAPRVFRKQRRAPGRRRLCAGVYGVSERMNMKNIEKPAAATGETVLYGVPKVGYGVYGCTPLPICLKAAANYLGEDIGYDYAMVSCGAAFRLAWDETGWNGGNVDVMLAFDDPAAPFRYGIEALGRRFSLLSRQNRMTRSDPDKYAGFAGAAAKEDFSAFIRSQIDRGYPCLALGVIGPSEACLVTGYRNGGDTLLGWNFFQDSPEFSSRVSFDESGYFITDAWWDNEDTIAVMSMGEKETQPLTLTKLTDIAVAALTPRRCGKYAKGLAAYDAWKRAITDNSQFPREPVLPLLAERLMCQGDAMDCLADGRENAGKYFAALAEKQPGQPLLRDIAEYFKETARCVFRMYDILGGFERNEAQLLALAQPEVRRDLAHLIDRCKASDEKALAYLQALAKTL